MVWAMIKEGSIVALANDTIPIGCKNEKSVHLVACLISNMRMLFLFRRMNWRPRGEAGRVRTQLDGEILKWILKPDVSIEAEVVEMLRLLAHAGLEMTTEV